MGRDKPPIHGYDHAPDGPDPTGASLLTTDGSLVIPRTDELLIPDGRGLVLTNPGGAFTAEIDLDDYTSWTPDISGTSVDPNLGSVGVVQVGGWTRIGDFVHAWGHIVFGSSPSLGTGDWLVDLPVPTGVSGSEPIGRAYLGFNLGAPGGAAMFFDCLSAPTQFTLAYLSASPMGNMTLFGSASGWTLNSADTLTFGLYYAV